MIADDLFAGAGGWDLAAAQLGIHARGVENMKEARATRDAAGLTTIHDDVWTFKPDGEAEGLIASPPCQTFSAAGKGSGRKALDDVLRGIRDDYVSSLDHLHFLGEEVGDNRTALVLTPLHYALAHPYEWLAWEQVPTVLPVWEACAGTLREHGWNVRTGLLQAEMFGVPQTRKRAFLLASRDPVARPTPTHSRYYSRTPDKLDPGVAKWVSMAEALGWDRYTSRPDFLRMTKMANSAVRPIDHPAPTIAFGHDANSARWFKGDEWMFHRPATTVQGDPRIWPPGHKVNADDQRRLGEAEANERYGDRAGTQSVRVTVHEAGILQSFPTDYPWQGAKGKQFLQAGNAVPPGLALHALAAAAGVDANEVAA